MRAGPGSRLAQTVRRRGRHRARCAAGHRTGRDAPPTGCHGQDHFALGLERAIQTALGGGCNTALGAHATADTLYLYHEKVGVVPVPIGDAELAAPAAAAARILGKLGLL